MHQRNLTEGLRKGDLESYISDLFTIDQFKSKMGEDKDIVVLGFKVKEKNPAIDLMEFIEKGYDFILDADMSAGEEHDGQYQVFVEIERTPQLAEQLNELLGGVGDLCDCYSWRFRYQKAPNSLEYSQATLTEHVPLTPEAYESKMLEIKNDDVAKFFNQGAVTTELDENNNLKFSKPYSGDITAKFLAIGDYKDVASALPGALSLDESSQSEVVFLNKYLGNYVIDKIGNKFLIGNGSQGIIIEKGRW